MVKPVLLIRSENNEVDADALSAIGIPSAVDPYVAITASIDQAGGRELFELLRSARVPLWVIATSRNAIHYWAHMVGEERFQSELRARPDIKFAAIGEASAQTLHEFGAKEVFTPSTPRAQTLAEELSLKYPKSHALIPGGNLAMSNLPAILRIAGWKVSTAEVYSTTRVSIEPTSAEGIRSGEFSAVLLRSPSAVDALIHFVPKPQVRLVCAGSTTAAAVQVHGLQVDALSPKPTPGAVADTIHSLIFR